MRSLTDPHLAHGFEYASSQGLGSDPYLLPVVIRTIRERASNGSRILDIGCGNGSLAGRLADLGFDVTGIDISESGIAIAADRYPSCRFVVGPISRDLPQVVGQEYDLAVSTEVIEHLYDPRQLTDGAHAVLKEGGTFICSTPYHGWLKNMLLALTNRFDVHWSVLHEGGHIKFFSPRTLRELLYKSGFEGITFYGAGRVPLVWKSMIAAAHKAKAP